MKKFFIKIFIFVLFIAYSNAQEIKTESSTSKNSNKLLDLSTIIRASSLVTIYWTFLVQSKSSEAITFEQMKVALDTFGVYSPMEEYQQALKYRNEMKNAFQYFNIYCDNFASFIPNFRHIPFRFVKKDTKKCVLLSDIVSSNIYNTLRLTSKNRASKVLESCLLPKIENFYNAFKKTDIYYFGFIIYYGSKDFSEDSYSLEPEMLAFIVSRSNCEKFINSSITESEFVNRSEVYLRDRDMSIGFKKVTLDIE